MTIFINDMSIDLIWFDFYNFFHFSKLQSVVNLERLWRILQFAKRQLTAVLQRSTQKNHFRMECVPVKAKPIFAEESVCIRSVKFAAKTALHTLRTRNNYRLEQK